MEVKCLCPCNGTASDELGGLIQDIKCGAVVLGVRPICDQSRKGLVFGQEVRGSEELMGAKCWIGAWDMSKMEWPEFNE